MTDASDGDDPRNRPVELGVIKEQLRAIRGPKDVILVWQDAVIPDVAAFCYLHRLYRNEPKAIGASGACATAGSRSAKTSTRCGSSSGNASGRCRPPSGRIGS